MMRKQSYLTNPINHCPGGDLEGFENLMTLALDVRSSWNHAADGIWHPLTCIAYFCMEFMLSEALPIYSGGLGKLRFDMKDMEITRGAYDNKQGSPFSM